MFKGEIITKFRLNNSQNRSIVLILLIAFIVQAYIASWPDTLGDVRFHRFWCRTLANEGIASGFFDSPTLNKLGLNINWPPLYPYFAYSICKIFKTISPESFSSDDLLLDFFLKLPAILSNIVISLLIFTTLNKKTGFKTALLAMSAYALNPAIIFDTSYWGQKDALNSLFVLLSVILLSNKRPEWSWVAITLGVFTKPLAYPFAPIIALFTLKQFGIKRTLRCALVSIITTFLIFLPFIYINRLSDIIHSQFIQLDAMPYISVNAHNIWWTIGAGLPWVPADIKPFGLISYKSIGIILFGGFYIASIIRFWKTDNENSLYCLCASVAFGFFMLSTHMHENHFFTLFPLLSMIYVYDRRLMWVYIILTLTFLTNMALHDPFITSLSLFNTGKIIKVNYQLGDKISLLRLLITLFNSQINILVFCYWIYYFYLRGKISFNTNLIVRGIRLERLSLAAIVILFIFLTSIPFIVKAAYYEKDHYFISNLDNAEVKTIGDNYVAVNYLGINNDIRLVLYEHPPSQITYKLTLPEKAHLTFGLGLNPRSWGPDKGDGVLFEVLVKDGGEERKLFSKYIDPKNNIEDRKWHDEMVDLSVYGGKEINLSFVTTPGPNNNTDYDWAGWSNPKLIPVN
ncbi:MAG: hypothetical protein ACREOW_01320 [Thermodesulfobacteriota bacterium]